MSKPLISTIIPTIARPCLGRAVMSILGQDFPKSEYEIIVVNDSGSPLPQDDWQKSPQVKIIDTQKHERSIARNSGAAIAKGEYLHFLDDDDWLLPGAYNGFLELTNNVNGAVWLYGGSLLVDRNGTSLIELHHDFIGNCFIQAMAGEWIPLQSSIIRAEAFFQVGGFNPKLSGPEDIDLCRRIALTGIFVNSSLTIACIGMGNEGSTTNQEKGKKTSRAAREEILNKEGVFSRMLNSSNNSEWYGHITRVYLTSFVWNIQHRKVFIASSRIMNGLLSLLLAGPYLFSFVYWHSLMTSYKSKTFIKGLQAKKSFMSNS